MKKIFLMIAFTGMVASVSASTFGDDKDKKAAKKECCKKKDGKACSGEKKEECVKGEKKSCCKKDAKTAESPATPGTK